MEKEEYNKSIETRELQLTGWMANFSHYAIVYTVLFLPVMMLFMHLLQYFQNSFITFNDRESLVIITPLTIAVVGYVIQKRRLRFRVVQTKLNRIQLKEVLIIVAKELEWGGESSVNDAYIATTNPPLFSGSWGEQITILFYKDYVLVNSICDLKKKQSVVSWGRNRRNEETLIDKIMEADPQSKIVNHSTEKLF